MEITELIVVEVVNLWHKMGQGEGQLIIMESQKASSGYIDYP